MADVAANLYSWSTTASSNSPSDATTIGAGLADNLQEIQAVTRAWLAHKGADIASATTTDIGAVAGLFHDITGTTTITGFGTVSAGIWKVLKFEGALTLTHNATSLITPGAANITTAAGDMCMVTSEGSGNWRVNWYVRASGSPFIRSTVLFDASTNLRASTSDGSDNVVVTISSGGAAQDDSRGAYLVLGGNESSASGSATLQSGNIANTFSAVASGTSYLRVLRNAGVVVNDTDSANNLAGVTINQGSADDEIISLKSSDVDHGATGITEADTYGALSKATAASGGLEVMGIRETGTPTGLRLRGLADTPATSATTSAEAVVMVQAQSFSGTAIADHAANALVFGVSGRVGSANRSLFFVDEDGDLFNDGASGTATTFDHFNDAALVRALDLAIANPASLIRDKWDEMVEYQREDLERAGILTKPKDGGQPMVNITQLQRLHNGAIWQLGKKCYELEGKLEQATKLIERLQKALPSSL